MMHGQKNIKLEDICHQWRMVTCIPAEQNEF